MNQLLELNQKILRNEWDKTSDHLWRIHDLLIATPEIAREYKKESEKSWYQDDVLVTEYAFRVDALLEEIRRISTHPMNRATGLIYMVHELYSVVETTVNCRELLLKIVDAAIRIEAQFADDRYLNFAYGSNMDEAQMAERCPNAILIGKGTLPHHRFALDAAGVATVLENDNEHVEGLVWSLTQSDLRTLDHREGVGIGCYRKETLAIEDGICHVDAVVYVSQREIPEKPVARVGYMERIVTAAKKHSLSDDYQCMLKAYCFDNNAVTTR